MQGRIVSLNCGVYKVVGEKEEILVPAKGKFRVSPFKPVVGDLVIVNEQNVISEILPRLSYLKRPTVANISQMFIVQSLIEPLFSYQLIFKYLTYANMNNIKAHVILTKSDRYFDEEKIKEIIDTFKAFDIKTFVVSNKSNEGIDNIKGLFNGEISCLIGQSGVGKSSFINAIDPNNNRNIGEYSKALGRGKHETKEVILLPFMGGYIADTPGFSSLDLELFKEDLAIYFPSFNKYYTECYFSNCLHISENRCAIKEMVNSGKIPLVAYQSYLKLSEEAIYKKERFNR